VRRISSVIVTVAAFVTASLTAKGATSGVDFHFDPTAILGSPQTPPDDSGDEDVTEAGTIESVRVIEPFGAKGSWRWTIQGAYGQDLRDVDTDILLLGGGLTYFFIDGLSINAEFNGMYFAQGEGDNAGGFNFNLLFRWHFIRKRTWSIYGDAGAGLLITVNDVPVDGSGFNFTPQAGLGATFAITEDIRLMAGVRWHHVSNAALYDNNPGLDSVIGYVGISVPF